MTVHVHKNNKGFSFGDHEHRAPAEVAERTWTFSCPVSGCEERVLRDVQHTGRNAASVPLTVEETQEEEQLSATSKKDVSMMAMALSKLAKDQVKENA